MNFDYVVQRQEKGRVCFGSGLERKTLEDDTRGMTSRHARTHLRQNLPIAPGMYEIPAEALALGPLMNRPTSKLGTVLGGRKAQRKYFISLTPGPGEYNLPPTFPNEYKQFRAPFNSSEERKAKFGNVPGVGTYKTALYKRRRVNFKHTFGGKKCLQPSVKVKCCPFNFDKCERCQKFPEGDYWYLDTTRVNVIKAKKSKQNNSESTFLCRSCYEIEKKEKKLFGKGEINYFKKIRDCSKIHFHDGCKAKLFIVSPQEIEKLKEREAYLSLFFN